jgi:hypothetical protein
MDTDVPQQKSTLWIIFLLLLIIVGGVLALGSLSIVGTKTTTQTAKPCPIVDEQVEAFKLAQIAEHYRKLKPDPRNYGLGSYVVCYTNGLISTYQTPVFPGNTDKTLSPTNIMHSEQQTYRQLQKVLADPALHIGEIVNIFVIIFSQVTVCGPCQSDMISWQDILRQKAGVEPLFLSVWDLIQGNGGFDPQSQRAGTGIPVTPANLRLVTIPFAP